MVKTLIIGKNSNLSIKINNQIKNSVLISSRELIQKLDILDKWNNSTLNIIFNNFQPAVSLNELQSAEQYIINSIGTTAKLLDYFKIHNIKINKIIYTSSSSVYGNNIFCNEKDELKPISLHASLKVANEKLIENFCLENRIEYTIARVFNMYGGHDQFSIVSKIINACKDNKTLTVVNNGNAIRDFIHIDDVVEIYLKLLKSTKIPYINVGTGNGISIKSIIDYLKNNNINVLVNNIIRSELKISTADNQLLIRLINKKIFKEVHEYLKEELSL
jgi:nucleoside-diphosphate-sugar epimerase